MSYVLHIACTRPLVYEADRLRRIVVDEGIDYLGVDSVAPACHDEPSSRRPRPPSFEHSVSLTWVRCSVAHTPKATEVGQCAQLALSSGMRSVARFGTSHRSRATPKSTGSSCSLAIARATCRGCCRRQASRSSFGTKQSRYDVDVASESSDLAARLPLWQRMRAACQKGPRTLAELASKLDTTVDTLDRTVRRKSGLFGRVSGSDGITRIALAERRGS